MTLGHATFKVTLISLNLSLTHWLIKRFWTWFLRHRLETRVRVAGINIWLFKYTIVNNMHALICKLYSWEMSQNCPGKQNLIYFKSSYIFIIDNHTDDHHCR